MTEKNEEGREGVWEKKMTDGVSEEVAYRDALYRRPYTTNIYVVAVKRC